MENYREMECKDFFKSQYKLIEKLGEGGFGKVFLCENVADKRNYAVKVIPMTESETEEFLLESQTLAKVDHPNIGRYHTSWMEPGIPEVVMDIFQDLHPEEASYMKKSKDKDPYAAEDGKPVGDWDSEDVVGESYEVSLDEKPEVQPCRTLFIATKGYCFTLDHQIKEMSPLSSEFVSRVYNGLVEALVHLRSLEIVHGDVKPVNVLLDEDFNPKLIDFGSAFTVGESFKRGGTAVFSKEGEYPSYAMDVYGFGMTMLHVVCSIKTYHHRLDILKEITGSAKFGPDWPEDLQKADADVNIKLAITEILKAASPEDRPDIHELGIDHLASRFGIEGIGSEDVKTSESEGVETLESKDIGPN